MDESGTDEADYRRKVESGRRVAGAIRCLINAKGLQLVCVRGLMYGSEITLWREKERFRFRDVKMDNLRGLLGIRRMDEVPNARTRELYIVTKGGDDRGGKRIDVERMTGLLRGSCRVVCW